MRQTSPLPGLAMTLASAALFGASIVYTRLAAFAGINGVSLVFYRVALMTLIIAALAAALRHPLRIAPEERWTHVLLALATAGVGTAYLSSVAFIPVTVAVVIFYTFPVLIVLASPFVEGTRLTFGLLASAGLALAGVVLAVGPVLEGLDPRGLALAALASIATAIQFFAAARCRSTGIIAKVFWVHVLVLPTAALVALLAGGLTPPGALAAAVLPVAVTIAGYLLGFMLQFAALARTSAVVAGIAYCLEPVVATASSALVLGESLSGLQIVGGALVLAAIAVNVILEQKRSPSARAEPLGAPVP